MPGKLSVSRAFGDICAKDQRFGGNSKVLIAAPEITKVQLNSQMDFIVIGCKPILISGDGIFDVISSEQLLRQSWISLAPNKAVRDIHKASSAIVNHLIRECMHRRALDNLTVIVIGLQNLESYFTSPEAKDSKSNLQGRRQIT